MSAAPVRSRSSSRLALLLAPVMLLAACLAQAANLGPILLSSSFGEPLQGLVSLSLGEGETEEELGVTVGTHAEYGWLEISRADWMDDVQLHATSEDGEPRVRLWTTEPPPDRRFSLLLVVSSATGRSLRQYDVVLRDAEVLLAPAEPAPRADLPVERPGVAAAAVESEPAPVARPSRRAAQPSQRAAPQVRRNLTISSASSRLPSEALERRAQRIEETAAAQQRALNEANSRIAELQGQIDKLERLLALKGAAPAVAEVAKPADLAKPSEAAKPADAAKPDEAARPADTAKPADGAKPEEAAKPGEAEPPAPVAPPPSAAAPMVEVEPAAPAAGTEAAAPASDAAATPPVAPEDDDLTTMLLMVGGVVLTLLVATLAALWWRRRRARQAESAQAAAVPDDEADGFVEADESPAAAPAAASEPPPEPVATPVAEEPPAAPAVAAAAIERVDASLAAAIDAPLGNVTPVLAAAPVTETPVASLAALTAEPAVPDDLDAMFSEEAIAAAQAAIRANTAAPAVAEPAPPPLAAAPAEPPAAAAPAAEEAEDEADDESDLDDVEVNLAKAYIDMGDPDGARAILEGMMSDPDDPDRAAMARRTMRRFGLKSSPPPGGDAASG